ncbi:MAG: hypothetical protein IIB04_07275 [Acidobacteria bacterium]|nr:hypothetical protein [Acidobacteriota bacterium]
MQLDSVSRLLYVAGSTIRAIDLDSGGTPWVIPLDGTVEGVVVGAKPHHLFVTVKGSNFQRELVRVDLCTRRVDRRLAMSGIAGPDQANGIRLATGEVMAVHPLADRLYLWRSWREDTLGIASVDLGEFAPTAFSGPWNVAGGGIVLFWPGGTNETLGVIASRDQNAGRSGTKVYLLDPHSLNVRDSIDSSDLGQQGQIWDLNMLGDGRTILVGGAGWLVTYDTDLRQPVRSVARPVSGVARVSPDQSTVVLTDSGVWPDFPGSGLLHLFDAQLSPIGTVDVSTPLGGLPGSPTATVTRTVAFADDGRTAYVASGTLEFGPLYATQTVRIIAVDLQTRTVLRVYELGGHEMGWPFLSPSCE